MIKLIKSLINNRDLIIINLSIIITIIIIIVTLFAIIGGISKERMNHKMINKIIEINKLNYELSISNNKILEYQLEYNKLEFIDNLRDKLKLVFWDVNHFNVDDIDGNHLYFMERQRVANNIPMHIYYRLIFAESGFRMFDQSGNVLRSDGGAIGYMQMLNSTFNWINYRYKLNLTDITNPYDNIIAGTFYLKMRNGNIDSIFPEATEELKWKLTIASYNAGLEDVRIAGGIPTIRYHNSGRFNAGDLNTETTVFVNFITRNFIKDEQLLAML